ncbi:CapA family protein [Candidatus Uhrbacteria bacterium]|nr:CapA family protein [Candidatus Uhrbacteria bacterium]
MKKIAFIMGLVALVVVAITAMATVYSQQQQRKRSTAAVVSTPTPEGRSTLAPVPPTSRRVSFAIAGDIMLARSVRRAFGANAFRDLLTFFDATIFEGVDAAIANLEGALSDKPVAKESNPHTFVFHFPPEGLRVLEDLHLSGVSLANNHSLNAGTKGLATTRRVVQEANIKPIGDPQSVTEDHVGQFEGNGLTLYIIAVNDIGNGQPHDPIPLIRRLTQDPNARAIVFPHWGVEYAPRHSKRQEQLAHDWIDAGADAVIGGHPHVVQDMELYHNKPIVYSLGNFIFDQMFSAETQRGLIVKGEFIEDQLVLAVLPIESNRMQPRMVEAPEWFDRWLQENKNALDAVGGIP